MSTQRILRGTTTTLVTYPRIETGEFVLGVPSSPEVRIGTAAVALPSEDSTWSAAAVETIATTLTAAAEAGSTELAVEATVAALEAAGVDAARTAIDAALVALGVALEVAQTFTSGFIQVGLTHPAFVTLVGIFEPTFEASAGPLSQEQLDTISAALPDLGDPPPWVRGRRYLLIDDDGDPMVVTCAKSGASETLYLTQPIERAVSAAATVQGWAMTVALTAPQTANVGGGQAVFRAVVDGVTVSWSHPFRVVRRMVVIPLTGSELTGAYANVHSLKPATQTLEEVIDAAWEYRLLPTLLAKGVREEDIVDAEALRALLACACLVHLAILSRSADPTWRDGVIADYERLTATTFARVDWHDAPQDVDPPRDPDLTKRRMGMRMRR